MMKSQKLCLVKHVLFILALFLSLTGFVGQSVDTISFSGTIERIDQESKFILVSATKVFFSANSRVVDEKGNPLKIGDLRPRFVVSIEGVRSREGFVAKRIVLKTQKKNP
jgi:hypothetical protein